MAQSSGRRRCIGTVKSGAGLRGRAWATRRMWSREERISKERETKRKTDLTGAGAQSQRGLEAPGVEVGGSSLKDERHRQRNKHDLPSASRFDANNLTAVLSSPEVSLCSWVSLVDGFGKDIWYGELTACAHVVQLRTVFFSYFFYVRKRRLVLLLVWICIERTMVPHVQLAVQTNTQTDRQEIRPHFDRLRGKLVAGPQKYAWNPSVHDADASVRSALPKFSLGVNMELPVSSFSPHQSFL